MFIRTERNLKEFIYAYPIVTTLVIINFLLWFFVYIFPLRFNGLDLYQWGAGHNLLISEHGEYWRLITPIFLHGGFMHFLFNSFSLVLFGPALEQMLGKSKFISIYLLTGLIGNIGTYAVDPMSFIPHIGASGAIYGLFGIYVFMVIFRKDLIDAGNAQLVMIIFAIGLFMTFTRSGINIYAHIFGAIGGFALGKLILANATPFSIDRNRKPKSKQYTGGVQFDPNRWQKRRLSKQTKTTILWTIIIILVILGIIGQVF